MAEMTIIVRIAERAENELGVDYRRTLMDLEACHCNGCPLDLEAMLHMPKSDFGHDIHGIARHIDRTTGKLLDCFDPRCSLPQSATA